MGVESIIGAGAGLVGQIWGSNKAAQASNNAANAAAAANMAGINSQQQIYNQQRGDFAPYAAYGASAIPMLISAMTGKEVNYTDPTQATKLTPEEITKLNAEYLQSKNPILTVDPNLLEQYYAAVPGDRIYKKDTNYYRLADGTIVDQANLPKDISRTYKFDIQESPAYKFAKSETNRNMERRLAATGRSNSTYANDSMSRAYSGLAATEYQNQYNRLLDAVKIGQGAAASTGNAASTLSNAYGNMGNNMGLMYANNANTQASLYSGIVPGVMNTIGAGLKAYNYYNQPQSNSYGTAYQMPENYDYTKSYGDQ